MKMKTRLKILKRIAQATTTAEAPVAGSPREVALTSFPTNVVTGWEANNVSQIQELIDTLNQSLFYLSNGDVDFDKLKQLGFNIDQSKYQDEIKKIVLFSKQVYQTVLSDNGVGFKEKLNPAEKKQIIDKLKSDTNLTSMPDSGLNTILPGKIGGNYKSVILQILNNIR